MIKEKHTWALGGVVKFMDTLRVVKLVRVDKWQRRRGRAELNPEENVFLGRWIWDGGCEVLLSSLCVGSVCRSGPCNRKKTENWTGPDWRLRLHAFQTTQLDWFVEQAGCQYSGPPQQGRPMLLGQWLTSQAKGHCEVTHMASLVARAHQLDQTISSWGWASRNLFYLP